MGLMTLERVALNTISATAVIEIGYLSQVDWAGVQRYLRVAVA